MSLFDVGLCCMFPLIFLDHSCFLTKFENIFDKHIRDITFLKVCKTIEDTGNSLDPSRDFLSVYDSITLV